MLRALRIALAPCMPAVCQPRHASNRRTIPQGCSTLSRPSLPYCRGSQPRTYLHVAQDGGGEAAVEALDAVLAQHLLEAVEGALVELLLGAGCGGRGADSARQRRPPLRACKESQNPAVGSWSAGDERVG
jgi:hypothetical protein